MKAAWRYVEFFTANIRNPNTRRAYLRACNRFLGWSEDRGLMLAATRPHNVATYIEELQATVQAPSVKQQLAAIRMMFNWLVTGQVVPTNPAAAVRGPKHVVKTGKTPVLEADAWRKPQLDVVLDQALIGPQPVGPFRRRIADVAASN
jgi:site-specific recombinase XerD